VSLPAGKFAPPALKGACLPEDLLEHRYADLADEHEFFIYHSSFIAHRSFFFAFTKTFAIFTNVYFLVFFK